MLDVNTETCVRITEKYTPFQVSALCCAGGEENLIMLDRNAHKLNPTGTVGRAGSTFGPMHKNRVGEHEFEALMRTLDNLVSSTEPRRYGRIHLELACSGCSSRSPESFH